MPQSMLDDSIQHTAGRATQAGDDPVRTSRRQQKSRGQSIVEFAVLLPALVTILALAADFGRAFTAYIAITSAAREGAAYGMQSTAKAGESDVITEVALADIGSGGTIWGADVEVFPSLVADDGQGYQQVVVTVQYTFSPLISFPPLPSTVDLERTVKMRVLN